MKKPLKFVEFYSASARAQKTELRENCKELQCLFGMEWRQARGYVKCGPISVLVGMTKVFNKPSQGVGAWPNWLSGRV